MSNKKQKKMSSEPLPSLVNLCFPNYHRAQCAECFDVPYYRWTLKEVCFDCLDAALKKRIDNCNNPLLESMYKKKVGRLNSVV